MVVADHVGRHVGQRAAHARQAGAEPARVPLEEFGRPELALQPLHALAEEPLHLIVLRIIGPRDDLALESPDHLSRVQPLLQIVQRALQLRVVVGGRALDLVGEGPLQEEVLRHRKLGRREVGGPQIPGIVPGPASGLVVGQRGRRWDRRILEPQRRRPRQQVVRNELAEREHVRRPAAHREIGAAHGGAAAEGRREILEGGGDSVGVERIGAQVLVAHQHTADVVQHRQNDRRHRIGVDLVARQKQLVRTAREAELRQRGTLVDERVHPQHAVALRKGRVGVGWKRVGVGKWRRVFGRDLRGGPTVWGLEALRVKRRLVLDRWHRE